MDFNANHSVPILRQNVWLISIMFTGLASNKLLMLDLVYFGNVLYISISMSDMHTYGSLHKAKA